MNKKLILPIVFVMLMSTVLIPVMGAPISYQPPIVRRDAIVNYLLVEYPSLVAPSGWIRDWSNYPIFGLYTSVYWTVQIGLYGSQPVIVDYNDGNGTILHWEGDVYRYDDSIVPDENVTTYIEPEPEPDLTPRTTPTRTYISYDLWQYMLMPWTTANPIAGFNIYEKGVYTIQAWQDAVLVWESPLIHVWHSKGLNLIYYVGGARFGAGQITFILMKEGMSVDTYNRPF